MAEIAALANLAGVICCGLKLSISLYDFATSLGAAGTEIKTLGTDITLFCSVLKQVQTTLGEANNAFRISINAIQTTQDILDQSSSIFNELVSIFAKLQRDEKLPVDFLTRVRWTFKRAKVLLLRESLQSCTAMLHLMLTTMSFAQRIATRGYVRSESIRHRLTSRSTAYNDELEDETERALAHSLCLAQETTKERLEELQGKCLAEESQRSDSALTMLATEQELYKCYSSEDDTAGPSLDTTATDDSPDDSTIDLDGIASKAASVFLDTILEQQQGPQMNNRMTWASASNQHQSVLESDRLLRNWTNQHDPLAWDENDSDDESLMPSDSVSRYHGRSQSVPLAQISTFFESATSASDLGGGEVPLGSTVSVDERPELSVTRSADDAAFRSRQKVARLTGVDYAAITADWYVLTL